MKFGVARFDIDGQFSGALSSEASDEWASRFLFICSYSFFVSYDDEAPSYFFNKVMDKFELRNANALYETPLVEIIEVQVEKGFVISPINDGNLSDYGNNGTV